MEDRTVSQPSTGTTALIAVLAAADPDVERQGTIGPCARVWEQTIVVSGLEDEDCFTLYCEPEGAELDVLPGDVLTLTFTASESHGFEISHVSSGLVLSRVGDSDVTIDDKRGRPLRW